MLFTRFMWLKIEGRKKCSMQKLTHKCVSKKVCSQMCYKNSWIYVHRSIFVLKLNFRSGNKNWPFHFCESTFFETHLYVNFCISFFYSQPHICIFIENVYVWIHDWVKFIFFFYQTCQKSCNSSIFSSINTH